MLLTSVACDIDNPINAADDVEVTVRVSTVDYTGSTFSRLFPDSAELHRIASAFNTNYSEQRRAILLQRMISKVSELGKDEEIMERILGAVACKTSRAYILPTLAEKAKCAGHEAWLVQFTYGLGGPSFGHYKCFAFSIPNLDTLHYSSGR
ncbi:MAG: hypothetical protein HY562_07285 [Ignavibacteriales bacterium]|nr:hypothetical protein [Ignavibacteriales bacterium]